MQGNAQLARKAALYRTVPSVGPLTAGTLVAFLPELGQWDSRALTSLAGLAPWSRDSGRKRGHRAIRGGRGVVRKSLYLFACSVIQAEGELHSFYQNLRQRGKPGNVALVALVALMRKLLLQLNALARRGTAWVPLAEYTNLFGDSPKDLTSDLGYCSGSVLKRMWRPKLDNGLL